MFLLKIIVLCSVQSYLDCPATFYSFCILFQKSEAPLVEKTVLVIGVSIEDDKAELLLESEDMISVPAELLMNAMPAGVHSVEQLTSEGAVKLDITFRGSDVSSVAIVEMNCEV